MFMNPVICTLEVNKGEACRRVLGELPQWFGNPAALENYVREVEELPAFGSYVQDKLVGFASLMHHTRDHTELHVMGVSPAFHRMGIGRKLVEHLAEAARLYGAVYLSVKTLSSASPDTFYARTRAFYVSCGFTDFEEFPTLWGSHAPCLMMMRLLRG